MKSFDELFDTAILFETIEQPKNPVHAAALKSYYNFTFNIWLQQSKGWKYGDEEHYKELLTKENWKEFILSENVKEYEGNQRFQVEKLSWQQIKDLTNQEKILYLKERNSVFGSLYNTILTVCEFIKPIFPQIEPLKYVEYFLKEIDFEKINTYQISKEESLKYFNVIYYGLEQILKLDIDHAILKYQKHLSKISKQQIIETQIKLVELIGNLKRQSRGTTEGISFTQRYYTAFKSIESKDILSPLDYQILVAEFNGTILIDLLSSFEIIIQSFKEILPLINDLPHPISEANKDEVEPLMLSYIFESISKYNYIMNVLVAKKYCQPNTFIWKDEGKGNKGFLAAILKYLHKQQYYKDNKRPSIEQIKAISKNTFGWEMSIDTIKKAKPDQFDLSFIPPASTIN